MSETSQAREVSAEQILYQMLWDRRDARKWLAMLGTRFFGGQTAYGAAIAAAIDDHDRRHPEAPARGPERVMSIVQHMRQLVDDVHARPDYYSDAAAGLNASRRGEVDPNLLRLAAGALAQLPRITVVGDQPLEDDEPADEASDAAELWRLC